MPIFNTTHRRTLCAWGLLLAAAATLAGCGAKTGANALTKDEKALMSAPPGQPMPEEARRAMAAAQAQTPPPAPAPAPAPAAQGATP